MVPETVTQVDDMLIPRSNSALFHKLLSAPERVSGTDRGGPPCLFKRSKDTYQIKILKMRLRLPYSPQLLLVRRESAGVQECTGVILWTSLCRRNVSTFV